MGIVVADFETEDKFTALVEALIGTNAELKIQQVVGILEVCFACFRQCQVVYVLNFETL